MYTRAEIRFALIEILEADTGESFAGLADGDNLREGLGLDSVDVVSVISQVERRFHVRMSHEELLTLTTVGSILDMLAAKIAANGKMAA